MNIDEMQPGLELDQLVAEEIMGWTVKERPRPESSYPRMWLGEKGYLTGWSLDGWDADAYVVGNSPAQFTPHGVFRPSVDWRAAGVVFERVIMIEPGRFMIALSHDLYTGKFTTALWTTMSRHDFSAQTAPLAICRAAIKAVLGIDKT